MLALPDIGFFNAAALAGVQLDDAGAHVRAADVDRENRVVASQDPTGASCTAPIRPASSG